MGGKGSGTYKRLRADFHVKNPKILKGPLMVKEIIYRSGDFSKGEDHLLKKGLSELLEDLVFEIHFDDRKFIVEGKVKIKGGKCYTANMWLITGVTQWRCLN